MGDVGNFVNWRYSAIIRAWGLSVMGDVGKSVNGNNVTEGDVHDFMRFDHSVLALGAAWYWGLGNNAQITKQLFFQVEPPRRKGR
jgi:hypothetical protein